MVFFKNFHDRFCAGGVYADWGGCGGGARTQIPHQARNIRIMCEYEETLLRLKENKIKGKQDCSITLEVNEGFVVVDCVAAAVGDAAACLVCSR